MVAEDAISCVAEGTGKSLDSLNDMQDGTVNLSPPQADELTKPHEPGRIARSDPVFL